MKLRDNIPASRHIKIPRSSLTPPPGPISYADFRQAVRRYRPSDLLPAVAAAAVAHADPGYELSNWRGVAPWTLSAIARESLLNGNEHRSRARVSGHEIELLASQFQNAFDETGEDSVDPMLLRLLYEQSLYQEYDLGELARTHMLLQLLVADATNPFTEGDVRQLLGGPLDESLRATMFIWTVLVHFKGQWTLHTASDVDALTSGDAEFQSLLTRTPSVVIVALADRFTTTQEAVKTRSRVNADKSPALAHLQRWTKNPLDSTPLVRLANGMVIAPQPKQVLRRLWFDTLYYEGYDMFGKTFTDALGTPTQQLVGQLLREVQGATVHSEIEYEKSQWSIDWFLVLPELLVLIEVKGARPTPAIRQAVPGFEDVIATRVGKAPTQISRTWRLMQAQHPKFAHIPHDRPTIGIVVTAEGFHSGTVGLVPEGQEHPIPILIGAVRDIDRLSAHTPAEITEALLAISQDPQKSRWNLTMSIHQHLPRKTLTGPATARVVDDVLDLQTRDA